MPEGTLVELFVFSGIRTVWAFIVAIAALLVARVTRGITMRALQRGRAHGNAIVLLGNTAQIVVLVIGALVILAIYTGDNFGWILTSFSVIGLVVGLSLQDILKNFFAGVWILVERPFRIGDTIEVEGRSGVVEHITFRTTLLRTPDGRQVVIPNNTLMTAPVVNDTAYPLRRGGLWLVLDEEQARGDPTSAVRDALRSVSDVASEPAPSVGLRSASDGHLRYLVTFWTADHAAVLPAALAAVLAKFPKADVHGA